MLKPTVKILCVDDEPLVLESMKLHLRRDYDVRTATSATVALELLAREPDVAVIVTDMRMPVMDGTAFLARARTVAPDAVRLVLTGQAHLDAAIAAVNQGFLFRFLTKPCPPPALLAAVSAAAEQHRLITAERTLLEQTLHGCMKGMTEILALANPVAFGHATRIRACAGELATRLGAPDRWQIELAAMLSQVAAITLPPEVADHCYRGGKLDERERAMVHRLPTVGARFVADVPRLEDVRDMLSAVQVIADLTSPPNAARLEELPLGARIVRAAIDFDALESQGVSAARAVVVLRAGPTWHDPSVLDAMEAMLVEKLAEVREVPVRELRPGMVVGADLKTRGGALLIARGHELTASSLERIHNFASTVGVAEPVKIAATVRP
jgi:response regulator RpfG family c-di-GMP phosphodiesterase